MNAVALMRFLTRERIGFQVSGIDRGPGYRSPSRCTRWWKVWADGRARVVVDHQHDTTLGAPYWQARAWLYGYGFEFKTGPRLVNRR